VATPLLAIGSFFLWKQYDTLKTASERDLVSEAKLASHSIHAWFDVQREAGKSVAISLSTFKGESPQRLMVSALRTHPDWKEVFLVEPRGKLLSYAADSTVKAKPQGQLAPASFAAILLAKQSQISGYTTSPLSGRPTLLINIPIHQGDKIKSILLVGTEPSTLLKLFHGLDEQSGPIVTVIDASRKVIARTLHNEIWEGQDTSLSLAPFKAKSASFFPMAGIADGLSGTYALETVPDLGWSIVVAQPTGAALGGTQSWLTLMVLLAFLALAVSILLAFLATLHFTRNIDAFVQEAFAIGKGDLSRRVNVNASDELGTLAYAFNQMATKLEIDQEQKFLVERLAEAIRQSLDLKQILDTTVRELGRTLSASRCCLALLDDQSGEDGNQQLTFDHVWYDGGQDGAPLKNRSLVVAHNGVLRMILAQGAILSLDLLEEGTGPSPFFQTGNGTPEDWQSIRSLIACPIVANNSPKGLILVHQCNHLRTWSDSELELVQTTARHVILAMEHAQLYSRTKMMVEQEMLINHIVRSVRSSLDLNTILNTATEELAKALGVSRCQIAQPNRDFPLVITHEFHTEDLPSTQGVSLYSEPLDFHPRVNADQNRPARSLVLGIDLNKITGSWEVPNSTKGNQAQDKAQTAREAPIAIINDTTQDSRTLPFKQFIDQVSSKSLIAAPLLSEQKLVGLLMVHQSDRIRTWKASEIQLVQAIADQLAIAITHAHLFAQVRYQAITDGLTGLYNHVYFKHRLGEEIRLADRKGMPCSLLMIDLDNLKQINDSFGHPVGDAAIRHVAGILKTLLRSGDTAARYGGEEFVVILPETSLLEAALIGNRLCSQIANAQVPGLGKITASIGAASYPRQANDLDDLIGKADKALYYAKGAGRNQIWIYEEPGKPVPEFRVSKRLLAAKNHSGEENS
jgi:diguanylate cyclase (GGDEF)-like protein